MRGWVGKIHPAAEPLAVVLLRPTRFFGPTHLVGAIRLFSKSPTKMVEGHQCHRVGHFHRKKLLGLAFEASSPNGRFCEGAAAIHGKPLSRIEIHGKNLFYFFGNKEDEQVCVHFHFGMSGKFSLTEVDCDGNREEEMPETKPTTRLQLVNMKNGYVAHLSAMTVQYGTVDSMYLGKIMKLGADPLRPDADPEEAWAKIKDSKKSIGFLLMDQSVIAGVGNIYRAEILFKSGVHPEQPGNSLVRGQFDKIWHHSCDLLERGFNTGSIITVDPEEGLPAPWTRRYVYNQSTCGRCKSGIKSWDIATRTAYACPTCQPLVNNDSLSKDRRLIVEKATAAVEFVSHCAPDDQHVALMSPSKLTVAQLKQVLEEMALPTTGKKSYLVQRLTEARKNLKYSDAHETVPVKKEQLRTPEVLEARHKRRASRGSGVAKKLQVDHVATAKEAAEEKMEAGEGRHVEHVPLSIDDATAN
eukprot:jgi/Picsp_1/4928/NSC_02292-R1_formamidopyrimidine-dna glycosylase